MKVAILTMPLRTNYGGILQNYALQQTLLGLGHSPYTLDDTAIIRYPRWQYPIKAVKRFGKALLSRASWQPLFYERRLLNDYRQYTYFTRGFVEQHIRLFPYRNLSIDLAPDTFEAYIVGSDQVWRPDANNIREAFLDFTTDWNVRRIAYAASLGKEQWLFSPQETADCAVLAKRFDAISVREASGVRLCRQHLGVEAVHLADPTMLLPSEHYADLAMSRPSEHPAKGLFVHILDDSPSIKSLLHQIEQSLGVTSFRVCQSRPEKDLSAPIADRIQPPVENWLRAIKDADYVVTDSFHATVFSIMFHKRFLVIANPARGLSRLQSLLATFGFEECLLTEGQPLVFPNLNYGAVDERLATLRDEGRQFLCQHLSE